jgi:hypothetical protein
MSSVRLVEVVDSGGPRGKVLVANKDAPAGTTMLVEPCLLFAPAEPQPYAPIEAEGLHWSTMGFYSSFRSAPPEVKAQVLDLYPGMREASMVSKLEEEYAKIRASTPDFPVTAEEFVDVTLITRFNALDSAVYAFDPSTDDEIVRIATGYVLSSTLSRANHSCAPNCVYFSIPGSGTHGMQPVQVCTLYG